MSLSNVSLDAGQKGDMGSMGTPGPVGPAGGPGAPGSFGLKGIYTTQVQKAIKYAIKMTIPIHRYQLIGDVQSRLLAWLSHGNVLKRQLQWGLFWGLSLKMFKNH